MSLQVFVAICQVSHSTPAFYHIERLCPIKPIILWVYKMLFQQRVHFFKITQLIMHQWIHVRIYHFLWCTCNFDVILHYWSWPRSYQIKTSICTCKYMYLRQTNLVAFGVHQKSMMHTHGVCTVDFALWEKTISIGNVIKQITHALAGHHEVMMH